MLHCTDGVCIHKDLKCDGYQHCKDGSDEQGCYQGKHNQERRFSIFLVYPCPHRIAMIVNLDTSYH